MYCTDINADVYCVILLDITYVISYYYDGIQPEEHE